MRLPDALRTQARACASLGSPFMDRLLTALAENWDASTRLGALFEGWDAEDIGPGGASLPLRLAGGLHALVLNEFAPDLKAVYPPNEVAQVDFLPAVMTALRQHEDFLLDWVASPPQTNEVRRSTALIAVGHWLAARYGLPFRLSELGASGGLNLMWDHYALDTRLGQLGPPAPTLSLTPDWHGSLPQQAKVDVLERQGVDLNPLDLRAPDQRLRLLAYLWPDQPHRAQLTSAAIAGLAANVARADAIDWLANRLDDPKPGSLHFVFHTVAWQYFPTAAQARGTRLIEEAGARATAQAPLAWFGMENDGAEKGAALTLRLWPGDHTFDMGRADFHGRWVVFDPRDSDDPRTAKSPQRV